MLERGCSVAGRELGSESRASSRKVKPLGIFGILAGPREMVQMREELRAKSERLSSHERKQIADYLRGGSIVIALMEHTRDVLGGDFEVPGGSAIHTDGTTPQNTSATTASACPTNSSNLVGACLGCRIR